MFRRAQALDPIRVVSGVAWQDKVLAPIPFAPDWAATSGASIRQLSQLPKAGSEAADLPVVILAEADSGSRDLICGLVQEWGYTSLPTNGARLALETLGGLSGTAIALVNHDMGDMSGVEFCQAVRAAKKSLYIILVTERSGTEQLEPALKAGADDYLITPFDADELRARLRVGARIIALQAELAAKMEQLGRLLN